MFEEQKKAHITRPIVTDIELAQRFFDKTLRYHQFGYTLFGNKPLSDAEIVRDPNSPGALNSSCDRIGDPSVFPTNLEWQAVQSLIQSSQEKNYIIKTLKIIPGNSDCVVVINRAAFVAHIGKHIDLFADYLEEVSTAENVLQRLLESDSLKSAMRGRYDLTGIVFGIGRESSLRFQRMMELQDTDRTAALGKDMARADVRASPGYQSTQQEMDDLRRNFQFIEDLPYEGARFRQMCMRIHAHDTESLQLLDDYNTVREIMIQMQANNQLSAEKLISRLLIN